MDSNDLMHYLKGFVELVNEPPTRDQWAIVRAKVLEAYPAVDKPLPMHNPTHDFRPFLPPRPVVLDPSKLPPLGDCGCV